MKAWSLRAVLRNVPLGLLPLAIFGLGLAWVSASRSDEHAEVVAFVTSLALAGLASVLIGWLRPHGCLGAALGATVAALAILLVFPMRWPLETSAMFGAFVAAGEVVGVVGRASLARVRGWRRSRCGV